MLLLQSSIKYLQQLLDLHLKKVIWESTPYPRQVFANAISGNIFGAICRSYELVMQVPTTLIQCFSASLTTDGLQRQ